MQRITLHLMRIPLILAFAAMVGVANAPAQVVGVTVTVAPPLLPVYDQPPLPGPGYIWTPGYWAWDHGGYFWVPGTWVQPPAVGLLWTPGYWSWRNGIYVWNAGYWGPHVGFYGGVNYGFGYVGTGYAGGVWRGGVFSYNREVNNFGGVHITNVYDKTVVANANNHVSFNGGAGGLTAKPNAQELAAAKEHHVAPTAVQTQHQREAGANKELRASVNGGHPKIAATSHAGHFEGAGVVAARQEEGARAPGSAHHEEGGVAHHEEAGAGGVAHAGASAGHPGAGSLGRGGTPKTPKMTKAGPGGHGEKGHGGESGHAANSSAHMRGAPGGKGGGESFKPKVANVAKPHPAAHPASHREPHR